MRDPHVGDLLAVPVTGAYCFTMSNNYNGARRIPVVFADEGEARLVVRRERWDELLARDVAPLSAARWIERLGRSRSESGNTSGLGPATASRHRASSARKAQA